MLLIVVLQLLIEIGYTNNVRVIMNVIDCGGNHGIDSNILYTHSELEELIEYAKIKNCNNQIIESLEKKSCSISLHKN